jgi:hypothetical protein
MIQLLTMALRRPRLHWRAFYSCVTAENTAIARQWTQESAAGRTLVKKLARVFWHLLNLRVSAFWTFDF